MNTDFSQNLRFWVEQRQQMRKKLIEAQGQPEIGDIPEGYTPLNDEERMRLMVLPPGTRPTDELIDENRGCR